MMKRLGDFFAYFCVVVVLAEVVTLGYLLATEKLSPRQVGEWTAYCVNLASLDEDAPLTVAPAAPAFDAEHEVLQYAAELSGRERTQLIEKLSELEAGRPPRVARQPK